jgi:hypothetical protein
MTQHVKILGVLHIILGAFGVLAAIVVFAVFGGLAGFLSGMSLQDMNADVRTAAPFLGILGIGITSIILILSIPGIIIGIGLVQIRPWARIAGIVLSALDLLHVPFGTALGVYGLWVLLQQQTEALFAGRPLPPAYPATPGPPRV